MASESGFKCSICLEFTSGSRTSDYFVSTPGGHIFHHFCIKKHIEAGNQTCPMCREPVNLNNLTRLYGIDPSVKKRVASVNSSGAVNPKPDYIFKIVLLGNSSVGKSSLLKRFTTGVFHGDVVATTGCDVINSHAKLCFRMMEMGGKLIKLNIWDTVGQEKFKSVATNCVRNAHGVMLVYDVMDTSSFTAVDHWLQFVDDYGLPNSIKILLGNKVDVNEEKRMVSQRQGKNLATKLSLSFFETSAKESNNVEAAFRCLVGEIMESTVLNPDSDAYDDPSPVASGCRLQLPYLSTYDQTVNGPDDLCYC